MSDIRNYEEYRAQVLDSLGGDYTAEDLRNFERWRLKVLEGLQAISSDPEAIKEAVDNWLDDHPEATTTVQDGSVTNAKVYPSGNKIDLQSTRDNPQQTANANRSFIAGGKCNEISNVVERGSHAEDSHAEGRNNRAFDWADHVEGSGCIVDSKIGHGEGNGVICSTNDGHAEGNRTVAGRKYFEQGVTTGAEDAGDGLGVLNYIKIADSEGDLTSYFPNKLTDNIAARYGAGAQKDSVGNIYPSGMTPAVWDGDTLVTENDLQWAMHRICILRGSSENDIDYVTIAKCTYTSGVGTKVYYFGENPTTGTIGIYSSYSPVILDGGNGAHSEGVISSAWGYGSHAEGRYTRAWANASHAEGQETTAKGTYSHAEGYKNIAVGQASHVQGINNKVMQTGGSAEGNYAVSTRPYQKAYAVGKLSEAGDRQYCELITFINKSNVGWHNINVIENVENGKAYNIDVDVMARQIDGTAGTVGDTFAYNIKALIVVNGSGSGTVLGTPIVTLIGRSSGMAGDGITSGARVSLYNGIYPTATIALRYDGVADTTFHFFCHTKWMELKI